MRDRAVHRRDAVLQRQAQHGALHARRTRPTLGCSAQRLQHLGQQRRCPAATRRCRAWCSTATAAARPSHWRPARAACRRPGSGRHAAAAARRLAKAEWPEACSSVSIDRLLPCACSATRGARAGGRWPRVTLPRSVPPAMPKLTGSALKRPGCALNCAFRFDSGGSPGTSSWSTRSASVAGPGGQGVQAPAAWRRTRDGSLAGRRGRRRSAVAAASAPGRSTASSAAHRSSTGCRPAP